MMYTTNIISYTSQESMGLMHLQVLVVPYHNLHKMLTLDTLYAIMSRE
jgi:hypothetical protein